MRYRKQIKKTLWDEELDNDESLIDQLYKANVNNLKPYFDYDVKKYKCNGCRNEYENNETEINKGNLFCKACAQDFNHYGG